MSISEVNVLCPHCACSVSPSVAAGGECPTCGGPLPAGDEAPDAQASLDLLAFDLREAFASGAQWLSSGVTHHGWEASGPSLRPENRLLRATVILAEGTRLGDFELQSELGRGGMGVVYRAKQVSLNREVALKVLHGSASPSNRAVTRFLRESQAAGRLHHTNIVPVYAQGETDGTFYYAMELIEGAGLDATLRSDSGATSLTLDTAAFRRLSSTEPVASNGKALTSTADSRSAVLLPRTRRDYRRIAWLMAEVCDGIEHAHRCGIIHRDIKPQNLLLGNDNRLHLTDFGLAKGTEDTQLTLDGELMGTLAYMSPEQIGAGSAPVDHRTDMYSLGVTLYEVLTLRRPFEGQTREQLLHRIGNDTPAPPRRYDRRIPIDLETICLHSLEKEPSRRYASAADMAVDLRRFSEDRPILTRRIGRIERGLKWARRHKAFTAALVSSFLVAVVTTVYSASVVENKRKHAAAGLDRAYEKLVYQDYKQPERVANDLAQAASGNADSERYHRIRALEAMGRSDNGGAILHLQSALRREPADREALFMLAWAHQRTGESQQALAALKRADELGPPETAPEWFFRGLALHRDNPQGASESYLKAREIAGARHQFFPQATLHLARSYNQQMYQSRRIERFSEAASMLRELADYGIYGSYPHYLLSIAHRLAAEVYEESDGTRSENADEHFRLALDWATKGQAIRGGEAERPWTAAAECRESMGDFDLAIQLRTTALELATTDERRVEALGYRWRLYWWTGQMDEAAADLSALLSLEPKCVFFLHVYPMLLLADNGQMESALNVARHLAWDFPRDAQNRIWAISCLRILGEPDEAAALLAAAPEELDYAVGLVEPQTEIWVKDLRAFVAGEKPLVDLLADAQTTSMPWKLTGEAYFHAAALRLGQGDRRGALEFFDQAYRSFDNQRRFTFHAKIFRVRMRLDADWPPWLTDARGEE